MRLPSVLVIPFIAANGAVHDSSTHSKPTGKTEAKSSLSLSANTYSASYPEQLVHLYSSHIDEQMKELMLSYTRDSEKGLAELKRQEALLESLEIKLRAAMEANNSKLVEKYSMQVTEALERQRQLMRQVIHEKDRYSAAMQHLRDEASKLHNEVLHPAFALDRSMTRETIERHLLKKHLIGWDCKKNTLARTLLSKAIPSGTYFFSSPPEIASSHYLFVFCEKLQEMRQHYEQHVLEPNRQRLFHLLDKFVTLEEKNDEDEGQFEDAEGFVDPAKAEVRISCYDKTLHKMKKILPRFQEILAVDGAARIKYKETVIALIEAAKTTKQSWLRGEVISLDHLAQIDLLGRICLGTSEKTPVKSLDKTVSTQLSPIPHRVEKISFDCKKLDAATSAIEQKLNALDFLKRYNLSKLVDDLKEFRRHYNHLKEEALQSIRMFDVESNAEVTFKTALLSEGMRLAYDDFAAKMWMEVAEHARLKVDLHSKMRALFQAALFADELSMQMILLQVEEVVSGYHQSTPTDEKHPKKITKTLAAKAMTRELYIDQKLQSMTLHPGTYTFKSEIPNHIIRVRVDRAGKMEWEECIKPTISHEHLPVEQASNPVDMASKTIARMEHSQMIQYQDNHHFQHRAQDDSHEHEHHHAIHQEHQHDHQRHHHTKSSTRNE